MATIKQSLDNTHMELFQRIKIARKDAKLTQAELADACGVTPAAVAQWESQYQQRRTNPRYELLEIIARVTGKSMHWLLHGDTLEETRAIYIGSGANPVPVKNWDMTQTDEHIHSPDPVSPEAFGLRIQDKQYSPVYPLGAYLIIDPAKHAEPGDDIILRPEGDPQAILKHWERDGGVDYFIPFNERLPATVRLDSDRILGPVVGVFWRPRNGQ